MSAIFDWLYTFWNQIIYTISNIGIFDVIDIIIVAFLMYHLVGFLRESRAGQLAKGIVVVLLVYFLASVFDLPVIKWLLSILVNSALVLLVVVFQPELRRLLERVGQSSRLRPSQIFDNDYNKMVDCIDKICVAAGSMQSSKTGALIVFERETQLGEIIKTGTVVDATPSVAVVNNIFYPKSPLHDGAVIVRDGRIYAAGCILPLSQSNELSKRMGTRHRAAVGMSENSDAVVLIVSEETGIISIASNGKITSDFNVATASNVLKNYLIKNDDTTENKGIFNTIKRFVTPKAKIVSKEDEQNEE